MYNVPNSLFGHIPPPTSEQSYFPQKVLDLPADKLTKRPVAREPRKRLNFVVKYRKTKRRMTEEPNDQYRLWNHMCYMKTPELISAFCGSENCCILRKDHKSVYEEIRIMCSEILENRRAITRAVLKERADQYFRVKVDQVEFRTFVHQILDNVFHLNGMHRFNYAIPLKWRRITINCDEESLDTELIADTTSIETLYDKCMIGFGSIGVFGAPVVPNAVNIPMREEIREHMMHFLKLFVCDLIRTVFKSETDFYENSLERYIRYYYYDGDFDIPLTLRNKPEPFGDPRKAAVMSDWKPLGSSGHDEVHDAEESHWIHEEGVSENPNSISYARYFERHDLGAQSFPITEPDQTEPDHQKTVQHWSRSYQRQIRKG